MQKLSQEEIERAQAQLGEWRLEQGELVRERKFADFVAAMAFVNDVAQLAEAAGHHPDIDIRYNRVRLALTTHDAGGITSKDVALARKINSLAA